LPGVAFRQAADEVLFHNASIITRADPGANTLLSKE
jgi:hypothetical protein